MKFQVSSLVLFALCLTVAAAPAAGQTLYSNGPINGNTDAFTINFGFAVSDTFTTFGGRGSGISGLSFGAWLFPGDVLESAEVSVTSQEFGGATYFDQVVNFTQSGCVTNHEGFNVCTETGIAVADLPQAGTYWLNIQNAVVNTGDPVYWDENNGPSQASNNDVGTIPSESFTLYACENCSSSTGSGSTPEPSSVMLLGSGLLSLVGVVRRKLF